MIKYIFERPTYQILQINSNNFPLSPLHYKKKQKFQTTEYVLLPQSLLPVYDAALAMTVQQVMIVYPEQSVAQWSAALGVVEKSV